MFNRFSRKPYRDKASRPVPVRPAPVQTCPLVEPLESRLLCSGAGALSAAVLKDTIPPMVYGGLPTKGIFFVQLTNDGGITEHGKAIVNVYLSVDGAIDSESLPVGFASRKINLRPDRSATVRVRILLPAQLSDGTYTLLTEAVDPAGNPIDAANAASVTLTAPPISFAATVGAVRPAAIKAGRGGTLLLNISNGGSIASAGPATIDLGLSTDGINQINLVKSLNRTLKIKAGHSVNLRLHFVIPKDQPVGMYLPLITYTQEGISISVAGMAVGVT